jgi:hypothetical protein
MKKISRQNGQALVISVVVICIVLLLTVAAIESGNLLYEKIHTQNIADSGAVEGGLWYARSMNMLSLSNGILAITGVVAIASIFVGAGGEGYNLIRGVQISQDAIAGTGDFEQVKPMPFFSAAAVLLNGSDNKSLSVPVYNLATLEAGKGLPSFNVKRRFFDDIFKKDDDADKYYYMSKGEKIYVDKESVVHDSNIKNRNSAKAQVMTKNDPVHGTKFLRVEENVQSQGLVPIDIIESSSEHTLLVLVFRNNIKQILGTGFLKDKNNDEIKPLALISSAFVRIKGGKLGIFEINGANYEASLEHIQLPEIADSEGLKSTLENAGEKAKSAGNLGAFSGAMSDAIKTVTGGLILH